jgi:hypothetical protein
MAARQIAPAHEHSATHQGKIDVRTNVPLRRPTRCPRPMRGARDDARSGHRGYTIAGWLGLTALVTLAGIFLILVTPARADTNSDVVKALTQGDVYITNQAPPQARIHAGDRQRLTQLTDQAASKGIPEKIAIVSQYPRRYANTAQATSALRQYLDFSGVLILISPRGVGVSSDVLTQSEDTAIARKVRPICLSQGYTACALHAGQLALNQGRADKNSAFHSAAVFWIVLLVILAVIILIVVLAMRARQRRGAAHLDDLRRAANATLSRADAAVEQMETRAASLTPDLRQNYDRALGLRDRARAEIEHAANEQMMIQANEDAAQAVLALQGVARSAGLSTDLSSPLDVPERRCFYCGHSDRPPYLTRTIDDGKGNGMEVEICSECQAQLERGQTPQIATVRHDGSMVPWWAVPNNPWYYSYGGPTWQYWLPFLIGMDVGGWFGGGWNTFGSYGGNWDGGGWVGGQPADQLIPTDAGGADFGGWGDAGGFSDAGMGAGTPSDAGGADFGGWGDSGSDGGWGGDSGGSDSGGWG